MKHFTLAELTQSSTATKLHIDNTPNAVIKAHLEELVDGALDNLRETWGSGIKVTSGYRCTALNTAVGGSKTSAHTTGYAADTKPSNGKMADYQKCVLKWAKTHKFDQIIIEYPGKDNLAKWIHIGIKSGGGAQRKQIIYTPDGKKYFVAGKKFYNV